MNHIGTINWIVVDVDASLLSLYLLFHPFQRIIKIFMTHAGVACG